jgi:hypothetical protein
MYCILSVNEFLRIHTASSGFLSHYYLFLRNSLFTCNTCIFIFNTKSDFKCCTPKQKSLHKFMIRYFFILSSIKYYLFFFWVVLRFEFRALHLLSRNSLTWPLPLAFFCFSYFSGNVLNFCPGPVSLWSSYLCSWNQRCIPPFPAY